MKIQLETIQYPSNKSSFHFFNRREDKFESFRHFHPELELTYIEKGRGIRYIGDNISAYEPGDLVLIGKNLPHDYVTTTDDSSDDSSAFVFQFPETLFKGISECQTINHLLDKAGQGLHFLNPSKSILIKIEAFKLEPSVQRVISFMEILDELTFHQNCESISSITFAKSAKNKKAQDKISKVTRHISERFDQHISVSDISNFVHMTPQSFCRWFKQSIGCSFVTYLNTTRIEKACQMLIQTNANISNVSFKCGFETVSHFNRTFKKLKRMTPKEYRKLTKQGNKADYIV